MESGKAEVVGYVRSRVARDGRLVSQSVVLVFPSRESGGMLSMGCLGGAAPSAVARRFAEQPTKSLKSFAAKPVHLHSNAQLTRRIRSDAFRRGSVTSACYLLF